MTAQVRTLRDRILDAAVELDDVSKSVPKLTGNVDWRVREIARRLRDVVRDMDAKTLQETPPANDEGKTP
jgi:hypothetical protein